MGLWSLPGGKEALGPGMTPKTGSSGFDLPPGRGVLK